MVMIVLLPSTTVVRGEEKVPDIPVTRSVTVD